MLSFTTGLVPARFSERLRLLEELDPDELLDDEPERLDADELLPELLPLDELPDEEPREDFLVFFTGERPRDLLLAGRTGLGLSERSLDKK